MPFILHWQYSITNMYQKLNTLYEIGVCINNFVFWVHRKLFIQSPASPQSVHAVLVHIALVWNYDTFSNLLVVVETWVYLSILTTDLLFLSQLTEHGEQVNV